MDALQPKPSRSREYTEEQLEKRRAQRRAWGALHKQHLKEYGDQYRVAHSVKQGQRRVVTVTCETCGKPKEIKSSTSKRHKRFFCNATCFGKWQSTFTGSRAPRWAGGVNNRGPAAIARKARYRATHREELRVKNAAYHAANPEMKCRYRKNNHEKWLPKAIRWAQARRARELGATGSYTDTEWSLLCALFRGICPACGKPCRPTVDHIVPLSKGGTNDISNLQPLCKSCNCRKSAKVIVCYLPWPTGESIMHADTYENSN